MPGETQAECLRVGQGAHSCYFSVKNWSTNKSDQKKKIVLLTAGTDAQAQQKRSFQSIVLRDISLHRAKRYRKVMNSVNSALREYDNYLNVELERCIVSADSGQENYTSSVPRFRAVGARRLLPNLYGNNAGQSIGDSGCSVLSFDAWLIDPRYNDVELIEAMINGDQDIAVLYPSDPFNQLAAQFVIDASTTNNKEQRIAELKQRVIGVLGDLAAVEARRIEAEEQLIASSAEAASSAEELDAIVIIPRALSKPGMKLTRDDDYLKLWRFDVFENSEDVSSTFYSTSDFSRLKSKYPRVCASGGALIATAYRSFIDDLRTPDDAIAISDRLYYPRLEKSTDSDEGRRYSLIPSGEDEYSYRAWTWAAGACFRDQRVELALLEHFSYLAAIAWLVWNPVDTELLNTLIADANKHAHKVLQKAISRHYVKDHSDDVKFAKKRIGQLLHSKKHGIVAKAMQNFDRDADGYPDGWMVGLARFVFSSHVNGPVDDGRLNNQFYKSFTIETLRPLSRAIETATRLCENADILYEDSSDDDDGDDEEDVYGGDADSDTVVRVGDFREIEHKKKKGGQLFKPAPSTVTVVDVPAAAISLDDLVYRVNEVTDGEDSSEAYGVSGYLVDYADPAERAVRMSRVHDMIRYDVRDAVLTSNFLPNTSGSMHPHLNLSRQNLYALANIAVSDDHMVSELIDADSRHYLAEALFASIAHYCAQRAIDWTLVGHAITTLSDNVDECIADIVEKPCAEFVGDALVSTQGTRFISTTELVWRKALEELCAYCITSSARAIVDSIYPVDGTDANNRLFELVADDDVFAREKKENTRTALFIDAVIKAKANGIVGSERAYVLGAVMYDLLKRCVPYSRARLLAALRLGQEAHSAVVGRQISCASTFEVSPDELFCSSSAIDCNSNRHVGAALQIYRDAMAKSIVAGQLERSRLISSFCGGTFMASTAIDGKALALLASEAERGQLFEIGETARRQALFGEADHANCINSLSALVEFTRPEILKIDADDAMIARIAILPILADKKLLGKFVAKNFTEIIKSANVLCGNSSVGTRFMPIEEIGMAVALSNSARRISLYASAYATLCYLCLDSDASKQLFALANDVCANKSLRDAGKLISCDLGVEKKLLGAVPALIRAQAMHAEIVKVFAENNAESARERIRQLSEATQLTQFLSKDIECGHSKTPFLGAIKRVHKNGSVKIRIVGSRDHVSGACGFRRTIELDLEQCRKAYNLCRCLLPALYAGIQLARGASAEVEGGDDAILSGPFIDVGDLVRASNRVKVHRVLEDGCLLSGLVHRYESQSESHLAALSANVISELFRRSVGAQEPESAMIVQCANLPRYSAEYLDIVRHYLDFLVRRWQGVELALQLVAHRSLKESRQSILERYRSNPLSRYLNRSARDNLTNHYRFVRLLHDNLTNQYAMGRFSWLVPPDDDVARVLGANPTQAQIDDLILRCCIPPLFCDPAFHGADWNEWKQRYHMCAFSDIAHHIYHDVPRAGEMYCLKRVAPPLSAEMKANLRASIAHALVGKDVDDPASTSAVVAQRAIAASSSS